MNTPLISVIVPCFNQGCYLPDTLDSVLNQSYSHWECIVLNDGSTDDTQQVAQRYVQRDGRFKYIEQKNRGLAGTRNRGLDAATGAYIQFLDSDDVITPEKFERQLKAISVTDGLALAYCDYTYGAEDDVYQKIERDGFGKPRFGMERPIEDIAARWETEFSIPIHCFLFDIRLFRDHGLRFDEHLLNHEDWDCWMRVFALNPRVVHVPAEMAIYRFHGSSMCRDLSKMRRGFRAAIDAQLKLWQADPVLRQILERKQVEMNTTYLKLLRARRLAWWKGWVHWRIQKMFIRLFGTRV